MNCFLRHKIKKAWQTFVETYEIPVGKVQNWYNSIVDKNSADAAAKSFFYGSFTYP